MAAGSTSRRSCARTSGGSARSGRTADGRARPTAVPPASTPVPAAAVLEATGPVRAHDGARAAASCCSGRRSRLSLCMIVRDSARTLSGLPGEHPALGRRDGHRGHGLDRRDAADRRIVRRPAVPFSLVRRFLGRAQRVAASTLAASGCSGWTRTTRSRQTAAASCGIDRRRFATRACLAFVMQVHCPGTGRRTAIASRT